MYSDLNATLISIIERETLLRIEIVITAEKWKPYYNILQYIGYKLQSLGKFC